MEPFVCIDLLHRIAQRIKCIFRVPGVAKLMVSQFAEEHLINKPGAIGIASDGRLQLRIMAVKRFVELVGILLLDETATGQSEDFVGVFDGQALALHHLGKLFVAERKPQRKRVDLRLLLVHQLTISVHVETPFISASSYGPHSCNIQ